MNKHQRLKEYGMYIRPTGTGTFNLGWSGQSGEGFRVLATFPTWDDAYQAFESLLDEFWEFHNEDFYNLALSALGGPKGQAERERQHEEARNKLYELTKL